MNLAAIYHEAKSKYAYAFDAETLHIRIRTAKGDVESVTLTGGDPFTWIQSETDPSHWEWDHKSAFQLPMTLEYQTGQHDHWFIAVKPPYKRMRYAFVLRSGGEEVLYGSRNFYDLHAHPELRYETSLYFNYPYLNHEDVFRAPAWVKDTVWYQIFPERFADGDPGNNPPGSRAWGNWDKDSTYTFFGGDLQGVIDHLDYLEDLGINGIYFTPIFSSPSSHKYDTTNYYEIDPAFGTNELFRRLVEEAHTRGMRIMLDAVFNHCGWFHPFWQDVVRYGRQSKYYECFFIDREPIINFELADGRPHQQAFKKTGGLNFRTFAFTPMMPKWNTDHPLVKEHLFGSIRYWTAEFGVDAWRLDVSNEVSHEFWREFRHLLHEINPQAYILGENWDNSMPWLLGDQFDGVMNYELTYPAWNLLGVPGSVKELLDAEGFRFAINSLLVSYPKHIMPFMYNLIDSHDTPRVDFKVGGDARKVKLAYLLMMTFCGSPSICYGSEVGLPGEEGQNRRCMPWDPDEQNLELRAFVKTLVSLRKTHPTFSAVDVHWLESGQDILAYKKTAAGIDLIVIINPQPETRTIDIGEELHGRILIDLLAGQPLEISRTIEIEPFAFLLLESE